jgi:hypothetical protein
MLTFENNKHKLFNILQIPTSQILLSVPPISLSPGLALLRGHTVLVFQGQCFVRREQWECHLTSMTQCFSLSWHSSL